jgi:hypothetical protein
MAHYKRKRPRTAGSHGTSRGFWIRHWPRWWDIVFHTRPRRRRDAELTHAVQRGVLDADNVAWSVDKKPHHYYW